MDNEAITHMQVATRLLAKIMPDRAKLLPYDRNMVEDMAEKLNRLGANSQVTDRQIRRLQDILADLTQINGRSQEQSAE